MTYRRFLLISVFALLISCDRQDAQIGDATVMPNGSIVVTSNYPLYFFASRIVEGVANAPVIVLPKIDGDPAFWTPNVEQVLVLQSADAIILNGAGAEPWLNLISIDRRRLVDTSVNIVDRLIPLLGSPLHQHGPEGEHSHQGTAFTTWLDPQLAITQAESITDALIEIAPSGEPGFRANMANIKSDLVELDANLAEAFSPLDGRPVLFSHPVYQYLQRRYKVNGLSVHWEPDAEPSTPDWIALQQLRPAHRASVMIWENQPLASTATRLSDAGITSVSFRTLANRPDQGDYLSEMRANAERMKELLSPD
jgi:zinc transport system substrate-binding protein